jgi:preprotein translocase subunit SecD
MVVVLLLMQKILINWKTSGFDANEWSKKAWEELTGRAYTQKSNIAIVLDDVVYSAPGVSTGPISGGRSEISGA